jgi:hypothetical protein
MILSSEAKQAIVDSLAAIDLMTELLKEQRRALEAALQRDQRAIETGGVRPSADGHRRHHHKGPPTTLNIRVDGHTISESQAAAGMVKAIGIIGPARVESLGLRLGGQPLIVRLADRISAAATKINDLAGIEKSARDARHLCQHCVSSPPEPAHALAVAGGPPRKTRWRARPGGPPS